VALLDQPISTAHEPISQAEASAALRTGLWAEDPALKLVVQDSIKAESYESSKAWVASWNSASTLYQSPFTARYWEGTQVSRSSVPFFTVATAVNSLVPQVMNGLFYENPPFMIEERPGTTAQQSRAVGAILAYQLDDINFREELRLGIHNVILFGTGLWKWGWETFSRERKIYKRKGPSVNEPHPVPGNPDIQVHSDEDEIVEETIKEDIERPVFEHIVNLRHVLVDPTLNVPDISKAKYVIHRMYMTWEDLDKLRDRPGFDIPSREKLLELFMPPKEPVEAASGETAVKNPLWDMRAEARFQESTIDPFQEPLEVLERWDNNEYIVVLQKKLVIGHDDNPYGKIPFLSVGWWDVPEAFFSMGLAKTIGSEQQIQQGIVNTWLDNAALNLNGAYVRVRGKNIPTQSFRIHPGKIIETDDKDGFRPLDRTPAVPEAGEHIAMSQSRVDQLAGAGALNTSGSAAGHSNLARSAEGARMLGSSATTAPDFVEKLANQVMLPFFYAVQEMNRLLPMSIIKRILSDDLQHEYVTKQQGDLVALLNAKVKFSILAGAKMQARRNMAQALPILTQYLMNEQTTEQLRIAGFRVDVPEIMRMMFEASEWRNFNDVVVPMTPEEMQRAQANSPAAKMQAQAQAQAQLQDKKHQDQLEIVDSENIARAGREVLRAAIEKSSEPLALTGEPSGPGSFGTNA
jgi:hypothetical protein